MASQWYEIQDLTDIDFLMKSMWSFHDSCIKELWYTSGAFSDTKYMYPINSKRELHLIIQGTTIVEMVFSDLDSMGLNPVNTDYTCEMLGATLTFEDDNIVFLDSINEKDYRALYQYDDVTWIKAKKLKWRIAAQYIGNKNVYIKYDDEEDGNGSKIANPS